MTPLLAHLPQLGSAEWVTTPIQEPPLASSPASASRLRESRIPGPQGVGRGLRTEEQSPPKAQTLLLAELLPLRLSFACTMGAPSPPRCPVVFRDRDRGAGGGQGVHACKSEQGPEPWQLR